MIELSIIMISYNTKELTLSSLQSLFDQTDGISYEVILLDNNSHDGSADAITQAFPQVNLIASGENHGFAQGNNIAAKEAKGEYILLLNPDTVVLDGAIQKIHDFAENNSHAMIWGGRTRFADGLLNPASCWKQISLWSIFCGAVGLTKAFPNYSLFNSEGYGGWGRDSIKTVDIVSGCFLMLKRDLWEKLGGFSPDFFMYGEEADLCLRASKHYGAKPMVTPEANIIHYGGASEKVRADKMIRLLTAKIKLIRKHWSPLKASIGVALYILLPLVRLFIFSLLKLTGEKSAQENQKTWMRIWRKRGLWLNGIWDV